MVNFGYGQISPDSSDFYIKLSLQFSTGQYIRLSDVFNVSQGILAGRQNIFEISSEAYNSLPDKEKQLYRPLIESGSIDTGWIRKDRYIWYPYNKDGLIIKTEGELQEYAISYNYLLKNKALLSERKSVKGWWELTRSRKVLYTPKQHLFSQRFGGSSSFGFSDDKNLVIEDGNIMDLRESSRKLDYYFYLALFCSSTFEILLSLYSKRILKGYDLGMEQIKDIPIINLNYKHFRDTDEYKKLCEMGKSLSKGEKYVKFSINDIIEELYPPYEKK